MNNFDRVIENLNFKKIVRLYIIFAVIAAIFSAALLGYTFKDKLLYVYNYNKISAKVSEGKVGVESIKPDITALASQTADIVDILILDRDNKVLFSAKNSEFAGGGQFTLEQVKTDGSPYLTYSNDPNVTFKLIKSRELILSTVLLNREEEIVNSHYDNIFFENNFNNKKIYLLSYTADKKTGDKIYFISDVRPVLNGPLCIKTVGAIATMFFMIYWVLLALWVYQNAKRAKLNAVLWGVITLFTNLAGLFIYFIYKQNNQTCFKCGAVQGKANIYCTYCGAKINETCSRCETIISPSDCYCSHCGNRVSDAEKCV